MRHLLPAVFARRRRLQSLAVAVFLLFTVFTLYSIRDTRAGSSYRLSSAAPVGGVSLHVPNPDSVLDTDPIVVNPDPVSDPVSDPASDPAPVSEPDAVSIPAVSSPSPTLRVPVLANPDNDTPALALPSEYARFPEPALSQPDRCGRLFTPRYFDDFRSHAVQYCAPDSGATLQCFQGHSRPNKEFDSICIGKGAVLDVTQQKFALDCQVRRLDDEEKKQGIMPFDSIRGEWYSTGPRYILDNFVDLKRATKPAAIESRAARNDSSPSSPKFVLFIQREGEGNLWHCMTEIMTMTMTFDLLQTTRDPSRNNTPFFSNSLDFANTQVIVTDDRLDGPFFDLWGIFAGRPPLRWSHLLEGKDSESARILSETPHNIIIPLPGAANPIWQSDWDEQNCTWAPIVNVFANRVLSHYGIATTDNEEEPTPAADGPQPRPITLTFVDRMGNRRLVAHDALLAAVEAKHPHVRTQSVDFATISFEEQLRLVRKTDVLVGVHGAAFTHVIFMRPGRGAVVEIQPETNNYRGFRNLGFLNGLAYVMGHGDQVPVKPGEKLEGEAKKKREAGEQGAVEGGSGLVKRAQWHWDDVRIKEGAFMKLIDEAVAAVEEQRRGT